MTKIHDNARSEDIDVGDILWDVKQETIVGKEYSTLAETKIDQKVGGEPAGERKKIAETITFHPLYLKEVEKKNYLLFTDDLLKKVAHPNLWRTVKSFCKKRLRKADDCTSMDALMGLEGTLHHEVSNKARCLCETLSANQFHLVLPSRFIRKLVGSTRSARSLLLEMEYHPQARQQPRELRPLSFGYSSDRRKESQR